jgi:hypothetical protein
MFKVFSAKKTKIGKQNNVKWLKDTDAAAICTIDNVTTDV